MKKSKIFTYLIIVLFLVIFISMFVFGDIPEKITGFDVQEDFSRPAQLVDVNIYLEYDEVVAGENQIVTTKIINMGIEEADDVLVRYILLDGTKKNKISENSESVAVQTSLGLVKKIYIPKGLPNGDYTIDVQVEFSGKQASTSASFVVKSDKSIFSYELVIIIIGSFISLVLVYIVYLLLKKRKNK